MEAKEELRKLRESTGMNRKEFCAINVISATSMIHPVIDKVLLVPDKQI